MKIQQQHINKHTVPLKDISVPYDIVDYFTHCKISNYVYEFLHPRCVLKYGRSMRSDGSLYGERVYRQTQHIAHGWNRNWRSSSGYEFVDISKDFAKKYNQPLDRHDITVVVHDMTLYPYRRRLHPDEDIKQFEAELINAHKNSYGIYPIGNIRGESINLTNDTPSDDDLDRVFGI